MYITLGSLAKHVSGKYYVAILILFFDQPECLLDWFLLNSVVRPSPNTISDWRRMCHGSKLTSSLWNNNFRLAHDQVVHLKTSTLTL